MTLAGYRALVLGVVTAALPPAFADEQFSAQSLNGTYRFVFESIAEAPGFGGTGYITFDGRGGFSGVQTIVFSGGNTRETLDGDYTVNADGTGTMSTVVTYHRTPLGAMDSRPSTIHQRVHSVFQIDRHTGEIAFHSFDPRGSETSGRMRKR